MHQSYRAISFRFFTRKRGRAMPFTFFNLIHLLSYAQTETQDFPMISLLLRILKSRECWQLPSTCQRRVKDVILSQILIYNTLPVPSYTNLPCLPFYWVMFEHTRSFWLKKICALIKGWRLVISCLHKSLSFVKPITHECLMECNMYSVEKRQRHKTVFFV